MIHNFLDFINEATMGVGKFDLDYEISPSGKTKLSEVSKNSYKKNDKPIKLEFQIDENPNDKDEVLIIRPTTYEIDNLYDGDENNVIGNNKSVYNRDNSYFYKIITDDSSIKQKWAVVKQNSNCGLIVQFDKSGSSKRGNHFREVVFMMKMSELLKKQYEKKIKIYDKNNKEIDLNDKSNEFVIKYSKLSDKLNKLFENHCGVLIKWIKDSGKLNNLECIRKDHTNLTIRKKASEFIHNYRKIKDDKFREENNIPDNVNDAKWNPSDIWLEFNDFDKVSLSEFKSDTDTATISELNDYLGSCIENVNGLIGVSLKKTIAKDPNIDKVNSKDKKQFIRTYKDFDIEQNKKTVSIDFEWEEKEGDRKGTTTIDSRTFDTKLKSKVQLELRGRKGRGYVSGKAGSMIDFLLKNNKGEDLIELKNKIRLETDKKEIRKIVGDYSPKNPELKEIWDEDLGLVDGNGKSIKVLDDKKNSYENSRLQSIIFIDWLDSLKVKLRDKIVSDIVTFARSESSWSSPHLLLE